MRFDLAWYIAKTTPLPYFSHNRQAGAHCKCVLIYAGGELGARRYRYDLPWFAPFMTQNALSTSRWHHMMDVGRRSPWLVLWTGQVKLTDEVRPPPPVFPSLSSGTGYEMDGKQRSIWLDSIDEKGE